MSALLIVLIGVRQVRTARPFTIAVHAPHWPSPQPNFGPLSARSSLSTYSSGVVGSTSTVWDCPFTFNVKTLIWKLPGSRLDGRQRLSRWALGPPSQRAE